MSPDLITIKLDGNNLKPSNIETLKPYLSMVDAVAMGPGLGLNPETVDLSSYALKKLRRLENLCFWMLTD